MSKFKDLLVLLSRSTNSIRGYEAHIPGYFSIKKSGEVIIFDTSTKSRIMGSYSRDFFAKQLAHMRELLAALPGTTVTEIVVEDYVATDLFQHGDITREQLVSAERWEVALYPIGGGPTSKCPYSLKILNWMDGLPLVIPISTYYDAWEFYINGHPQGIVKSRPVRDLLAIIADEDPLYRKPTIAT